MKVTKSAKFLAIILFAFNLTINAQQLTITSSVSGQTGTSGTNWSTSGTNPVTITATGGTANVHTSVILGYLNNGTSVIVQNNNSNGTVYIDAGSSLTKNAGGDATLTLRANLQVAVASPITSTSSKINVILWSDYNNSNVGGVGLSAAAVINTNGGHFWAGGSSTAAGSYTWNGLTVGDGPSIGSSGSNHYAMDLFTSLINTNGGDILLWSGTGINSGLDGIGMQNNPHLNAGSGNVTLITRQIFNDNILSITTTGKLALATDASNPWTSAFNWATTTSGSNVTLTSALGSPLKINNFSTLGGLSVGGYDGFGGSFSYTNLQNVNINSSINIPGPIKVYGAIISIGTGVEVKTTTATGSITILGKSGFKTAASVDGATRAKIMTTGGGDIEINADADNNNSGELDIDWLTIDGGTGNVSLEASSFNWNTYGTGTYPELYGTGGLTLKSSSSSNHIFDLAWVSLFQTKSSLTLGNPLNTAIVQFSPCANCFSTATNYTGKNLSVNGPITAYGSSIKSDLSLTSSASNADVLFKAKDNINIQASRTITTTGGDVTLWSNSDASGTGYSQLYSSTSITTNGGDIIMGGGTDPLTSYGKGVGVIADATTRDEVSYAPYNFGISGVHFRAGVSLNSNGGNITLNGENGAGSESIISFGVFINDATINSGTGKITVRGKSTGTGSVNAQAVTSGGTSITSSNTSANAITIIGDATGVNGAVTSLGFNFNGNILATAGGGINVSAKSGIGTNYDKAAQFVGSILANSGAITITAENDNSNTGILLSDLTLGSKAATSITSSSSNVTLSANKFEFSGANVVNTSGTATIEPKDASFVSALTYPITNLSLSNNVSGLTLGKSTNTSNITFGSATSIAGPITVYGGSINANANITATGGNILLNADTGTTLNQSTNGISIANGVTIKTVTSGNITLNGNSGNAAATIRGIHAPSTHSVISAGNISMTGKSFSSSGGTGRGIDLLSGTITAAGTISMTGQHGVGSTYSISLATATNLSAGTGINLESLNNTTGTLNMEGASNLNGGTGDIVIKAAILNFATSQVNTFTTTGKIILESDADQASFGAAVNTQYADFVNATGLIVGKAGNIVNVTLAKAYAIAGPVTVYANFIFINENLNTTAGTINGDVLLKSSQRITIAASKSITTNGGDVVLWSDTDNSGAGQILLNDNVTINTINGSTSNNLSGGGKIILAGGLDDGSNGGTALDGIPDGLAKSASSNGVKIGSSTPNVSQFYSGGGDILIRGLSTNNGSAVDNIGVFQLGKFTANSGTGAITINGQSTNYFGVNFGYPTNGDDGVNRLSLISNKASGSAISITGNSVGSYGTVFNYNNPKEILATGGGDISITGSGTTYGIFLQNQDILASSGTITLDGGSNAIHTESLGARLGGKASSLIIPSSSSNINLISDVVSFANTCNVATSGKVSILSKGITFSSPLTFPITNLSLSNNVSGLTLGKSTNTANVTLASATSIAGPITVYGGKISANNDLSVSTSDPIQLIASKDIEVATGADLSTQGAAIILSSNSDGVSGGGILMTGSSVKSNGGAITLGGGTDGTNYAEGSADGPLGRRYRGLWLEQTTIDGTGSTANGNIVIRGKGWQGANWVSPDIGDYAIGVDLVTSTIIKTGGTGTIFIDGIGGKNNRSDSHGVGINLFNGPQIYTASGSLSINGTAGTGTAREYVGILMDGGTTASIYSSSGSISLTGNATSTYQGIKFAGAVNLGWNGTNAATTGAITFNADAMSFSSILNLKTTGLLTVQPVNSSFLSTLTFPITNLTLSNDISGLTLGKSTNTANVTLASATSIAGPITVYGGTIALNSNLTSTATTGNGILLYGKKINQLQGVSVITSGSNIDYSVINSPFTNSNDTGISLIGSSGSKAVINAQGGNIMINASLASTGTNNISSSAQDISIITSEANILTSGSGTISINGDAYNNASTTGDLVWGVDLRSGTVIRTVSGAIDITGRAGKTVGNARGVISNNTNLQVLSNSGTITFNDLFPTGNTSYTGMYFRSSSANGIKLGADASTVTSSSSNISFIGDRVTFDVQDVQVSTSNKVNILPEGTSFRNEITTNKLNLSNTVSEFVIGKLTNTANITFARATNVAGPITAYGGTITLDANLTTTNNGSISLYTDNALGGITSGRTLTAAGAFKYIPLGTSFAADVTYPISNLTSISTGLTIGKTSNTKNITVNQAVTGAAGIELYGNNLNINANLKTTSSGDMYFKGNATIASLNYVESDGDFTHNGNLVFKSAANGSAAFGRLGGTYTKESGTVTVERYIKQGKRAFRFLAPGVTTTNFISNNWQQATHITGSTTGALGFDQTATGNPSMYTYNNQVASGTGWTAIANTNATNLEAEKGYRILVRGDRTPSLITTNTADNMNAAITLSATGTLKTGPVTINASSSPTAINGTNNTTTNGFSLVANPYVSPIDWLSVTKTGLNGYYYVWDTNVGDPAQRGRYVSYSSGVNSYGGTGVSTVNNIIQAGQAFFVKNTTLGTAGTLTFNESDKSLTSPFVLRTSNQNTLLSVLLYAPTELALGGYPLDGITTVFGADFDNQIGNDDVPKLESAGENLAWFTQSKKLDINAQAPAVASDVLLIKSLRLGANKSYTFRIKATNFDTSLTGYLVDNYLNTQQEIDMTQDYFATFNTTSDALSFGQDRFKIIFSTSLNNESFESKGLSIYPNPVVDNQFSIQLPATVSGKLVVKIYNTLGQEMYQIQTDATNTLLVNPKQALATGVYIVSVSCDGKEYKQKIMVK